MRFKNIILSLAALAYLAGVARAHADIAVGQPAPALAVKDFKGHAFNLKAEHGKWVIVNFWASWCQPCREEMPVLNAFYSVHHGKRFAMIVLSTDGNAGKNKARALMKKLSYPAAFYTDATINGFDAPDALPETVIIRPDGTIGKIFSGAPLTAKELSAALHEQAKK